MCISELVRYDVTRTNYLDVACSIFGWNILLTKILWGMQHALEVDFVQNIKMFRNLTFFCLETLGFNLNLEFKRFSLKL